MWEKVKAWDTTLPAMVAAFFGFVIAYPQHFESIPVLRDIAGFALAGGLAALGINAKSASKGSDRPQEVVDEKLDAVRPYDGKQSDKQ